MGKYYTPRPDELPEVAPDISFLLNEDDALNPADDGAEGDKKPVRVLHDWSIFDASPRPKKRGDLALSMLALDALDKPESGCAPEGAGVATPLFENDEDAGQEDDGEYDDEGDEEPKAVSVRLRLGALLRYTIDYTKRDEYAPPPLCVSCALTHRWQSDIHRDYHGVVHPRSARA